jgi:hypothetical protein
MDGGMIVACTVFQKRIIPFAFTIFAQDNPASEASIRQQNRTK